MTGDTKNGGGSESLLSPAVVAGMLGVNARHVLRLPIERLRIGHRTVRFRLRDVEEFLRRQTVRVQAR